MKTKLTYILFYLIIAFSCKKKKEEPITTFTENKDIVTTSCLLTKEIFLVNDTITGSTEYQYDSFGRLLKRQSLNEEGVFSDSGTYSQYTYEGNKLISIKENLLIQIGKRNSEPTTNSKKSEFPYSITEFSYRNDTIISSVSTLFENETTKIPGLRRKYYYAKGNLNSVVADYTTVSSDCKSGVIDSTVFVDYSNGRPKIQIKYSANYVCPRSGTVLFTKNSESRFSYDANMNLTKVEVSDAKNNWSFWIQNEYAYDLSIPNLNNEGYAYSINTNHFSKNFDRNLRISEQDYSSYNCNGPDFAFPILNYKRSDTIKTKYSDGFPKVIESSIFSSYCANFKEYKTQSRLEYSCK
jgi:hypothetical protein